MSSKTNSSKLTLIGTGPGDATLCSQACLTALSDAEVLVGYGLYIDLLDPSLKDKPRFDFPLGEETERCRFALNEAAKGQNVALVCSGDAGIYAMSALVLELMDKEAHPSWAEIEIESVAGITAMQTLANKIGAPLGHDFCAISMSDLLTPWETIIQRLEGAAHADFVIGFYNPVSIKRDWQLNFARDLLLKSRSAETPVVVGRNLGREGESIRVLTLGTLDAKDVDMLSVVLVGSTQTRVLKRAGGAALVYTPRGYAKKNTENWS